MILLARGASPVFPLQWTLRALQVLALLLILPNVLGIRLWIGDLASVLLWLLNVAANGAACWVYGVARRWVSEVEWLTLEGREQTPQRLEDTQTLSRVLLLAMLGLTALTLISLFLAARIIGMWWLLALLVQSALILGFFYGLRQWLERVHDWAWDGDAQAVARTQGPLSLLFMAMILIQSSQLLGVLLGTAPLRNPSWFGVSYSVHISGQGIQFPALLERVSSFGVLVLSLVLYVLGLFWTRAITQRVVQSSATLEQT